jgi:amino acid permease
MKPRLTKWEWALAIAIVAVLATLFITGCASRGALPAGKGTPWLHGGPAGVLTSIAVIATALAGTGLIACAFLAMFYPDKLKVAKLAVACVTIIIGAQITYWLGSHLVLATCLSILSLVCGLVVYGWVHRRELEVKTGIDINRDGSIG